jgi:hypothetical protein
MLVLITMQYTVDTGDTLQSIAEQYCLSNNPMEVAAFREGIRELNYDVLGEDEVWPGMEININRWDEY